MEDRVFAGTKRLAAGHLLVVRGKRHLYDDGMAVTTRAHWAGLHDQSGTTMGFLMGPRTSRKAGPHRDTLQA